MERRYVWKTQSGGTYKYWVYELPIYFHNEHYCNYIFCRAEGDKFEPILIGEGILQKVTDLNFHGRSEELRNSGVTHVHVHNSINERLRLSEVEDLVKTFGSKLC
jgi:hypothetical protein